MTTYVLIAVCVVSCAFIFYMTKRVEKENQRMQQAAEEMADNLQKRRPSWDDFSGSAWEAPPSITISYQAGRVSMVVVVSHVKAQLHFRSAEAVDQLIDCLMDSRNKAFAEVDASEEEE